jgi:hypothetical protein
MQVKRDGLLNLPGGGIIIGDVFKNGRIVAGMIGRLFKDFIHPRRFIRLGRTIRLENNRRVKFSETRPKDGIIIGGRGGPVQRLQGSFLISSRERNFTKPFVSVDVMRFEHDSTINVIKGLIGPSKIFCVDERKLQQRFRSTRIRFDGVFQNVDRLRKIILPRKQYRDARSQIRPPWIDIQHFAICGQRFVHFSILFKRHPFNKVREGVGFMLAFGAK